MKKAKLLITKPYLDIQLKRNVKRGEEIIVSLERAKQITDAGFAKLIETIEPTKKPKRKK